jgi:hypothetical protein
MRIALVAVLMLGMFASLGLGVLLVKNAQT